MSFWEDEFDDLPKSKKSSYKSTSYLDDDYYGYNEPIDPNDYADGNPSDAIIYDALLDMDHEQLVSDMLSTAENNPSITLVKYLDKYDSSND
jgi:hypothetical protein